MASPPVTQSPRSPEGSDSPLSTLSGMSGLSGVDFYLDEVFPVYETFIFNCLPRGTRHMIFKDALSYALSIFSCLATLADLPAVIMTLPLEAKAVDNVLHILCKNMMFQLNDSGALDLRLSWEHKIKYDNKLGEKLGFNEIEALDAEQLEPPTCALPDIEEISTESHCGREWVNDCLAKWPECLDYNTARRMDLRVPWRENQSPENPRFREAWAFEAGDGDFDISGLITIYIDGIDMLLLGNDGTSGGEGSGEAMETDESGEDEGDGDDMSVAESLGDKRDGSVSSDGSYKSARTVKSGEELAEYWPAMLAD
ncbi:uncharacterized protein BP5553_06059 [Venustampulla echinocandica]|uniref:Uncharacterized protein n=1 Tax=Venustampulla echinocandica TaxID=2656787 RepID=A0A370TMG6_9HELO|nr:uncharacterized protein BP5553_06059 [Venustampulla echinocandica]RDL36707.1 hypothetical protein BP5553_06059 [Venustampulla echinocandica]